MRDSGASDSGLPTSSQYKNCTKTIPFYRTDEINTNKHKESSHTGGEPHVVALALYTGRAGSSGINHFVFRFTF